ncbi:MAG: hypothetical protein HY788_20350 [Deltaproteobacteria bacterium]|nr:hypothetical protein [Deltaproteobacteria bacterium]
MKPRTALTLLMVLLLVLAPAPYGVEAGEPQPESLKVTYAPLKPVVGQPVTLTLSYSVPEGCALPDKPVLHGLEHATVLDSKFGADSGVVHILADSLDSLEFEKIGLRLTGRGDSEQWLWSAPVRIPIASNFREDPEKALLKPIKDIYPVTAFWRSRWIFWSVIAFAGLLILGSCLWWFRGRRRTRNGLMPVDLPHLTALNGLDLLGREDWPDQATIKRFYFRFSEILREYVGSLRGFPALESTTEEISVRLASDRDLGLIRLLCMADQVKFADLIPLGSQKEEHLDEARRYIHQTMPKPEPQEEGRKAG